jgi:hypothetical protein
MTLRIAKKGNMSKEAVRNPKTSWIEGGIVMHSHRSIAVICTSSHFNLPGMSFALLNLSYFKRGFYWTSNVLLGNATEFSPGRPDLGKSLFLRFENVLDTHLALAYYSRISIDSSKILCSIMHNRHFKSKSHNSRLRMIC